MSNGIWDPTRKGLLFCSPACGRGCTVAEHDAAAKAGAALAARLGPTWKVRMWENLGWFCCAVSPCENLEVREYKGGGFSATLGRRFHANGLSPQAAVRDVLKEARRALDDLSSMLAGLEAL